MMTILEQNKRSILAGTHDYTKQVLNDIAKKEPIVGMFIDTVSDKQARMFCDTYGLDNNQYMNLTMMMQHVGAMVANAFISQKEVEELET